MQTRTPDSVSVRANGLARLTSGRGRRASERGSAVILVIIALVLMMLIGAAYLQSARVQRFPMSESPGDMNTQISAIIAQIRQTLAEDLRDDGEDRFELYDYPWTNTEDHGGDPDHPNFFPVTLYDGESPDDEDMARGGARDDTWLASSQPDFGDPANPVWPHITNLNGLFLAYDRDGNVFNDPTDEENQHIVNFPATDPDAEHTDSMLETSLDHLVDATGDGIPDSRWTWAPITTIDGVDYVMAVRIVDLSGKLNVNTALSQIDAGGSYDALADAPRWDTPAEIDFGGFVFDTSGDTSTHMAEFERLLEYRFVADPGDVPLPVPWIEGPMDIDRSTFWEEWGRFTVNNPAVDEVYARHQRREGYELLRRGGLRKHPDDGGRRIALSDEMPSFLRDEPVDGSESAWHEVDLSAYGGPADPADPGDMWQFFELEPRHQLTAHSGSAIFSWPLPDDEFGDLGEGGEHIKRDINDLLADDDGRDTLADMIFEVFSANGGASDLPAGFESDVGDFAEQFVANMANYVRTDNRLIQVGDHYGLSALPFITEVYAQARYDIVDLEDEAANGTTTYTATWERQGNVGYAIEIHNPFRRAIDLENIEVRVDGSNWGPLTGLIESDGQDPINEGGDFEGMLRPGQVLILYRDSNNGADPPNDAVAGDPDDDLVFEAEDLFTEEDMEYVERELTGVWPDIDVDEGTEEVFASERFDVELRIEVEGGAPITYSRTWGEMAPDRFIEESTDDMSEAEGDTAYWQHSHVGNARGLNIVAVDRDAFSERGEEPEWDADTSAQPRNPNTTALGRVDKSANGAAPGDVVTEPTENQIIMSGSGAFSHVGEVVYITVLGPDTDDDDPIREGWGGAERVDELMLDFADYDNVVGADNYNVPYPVFLVDRLTTLSPRADGEDNSGDGQADSTADNMVPGLVNLNTMPQHRLIKVLPLPHTTSIDWGTDGVERTLREEVAWRIVTYRDSPGDRAWLIESTLDSGNIDPADLRAAPGIAHTAELFMLFNDMLTSDWTSEGGPDFSGDVYEVDGVRVDFLGNLDDTTGDGIANDREESMMLAKWLSQVGSQRSDYFAAYVLVRGYEGGWEGTHVTDAVRFIAVFERNAVDGNVSVRALLLPQGPYIVN